VTSSTSPSRLSFARRLSFAKTGKGGHHEIPTRTEQRDQGLQIPVEHFDQSSAQELQILDPTEQDRRRHQGAGPIGSTAGISDNPVLDSRQSPRVRLVPNSEYLLGEGRHASVYLSSYIPRHLHQTADAWKLCAAKRVLPDRDSQLAGLGEAFILSKLNAPPPTSSLRSFAPRGSRFVIDLYGVRDERDGVESMGTEDQTARRKKAWNDANSAASLGLGRPLNSASSHSNLRASSEVVTASSLPQRRSLRRKKSFEPSNLSPPIGSPSIESPGHEYFPMPRSVTNVERKGPRYSAPGGLAPPPTIGSVSADSRTAAGTRIPSGTSTSTVSDGTARESKPSTPRIILLLEYAPYGHVLTFAQSYPERMGRKRWLDWAKQLVAAVAWSHERGVLHSDIKPQNVLVGDRY
jgi:serine/threonine protein kinase